MSAPVLLGYAEGGDYTERKKGQTQNKVIQNPRRLRRRATGRRAKQGFASSWRPFPRSMEAPPGCFSGRLTDEFAFAEFQGSACACCPFSSNRAFHCRSSR